MASIFEPERNCWRVERADKATVLIDAENYFRQVRRAMAQAKSRIVLVGWDFDSRVSMFDTQEELEGPDEIGDYLDWLLKRNPDLNIYILRWDTGAIKSIFRGRMILKTLKWIVHPRMHMELDDKHPVGAAQHQKIVAIDDDTAFCGGIDITDNRWDTREHVEKDNRRKQPNGEDAGPWHDATMIMQGPVAAALSEFAEKRWIRAGGKDMAPIKASGKCWPKNLGPMFENTDIAIARTQPEMDDQQEIREIESLYLDIIGSAKNMIYCESQYFASRRIAEAFAKRLAEPDGPEIVILNPIRSEGWLEPEFMDTVRAGLVKSLKDRDPHGRFHMFHALNEVGSEIYIHAKMLIIDDRIFRIGSSNLNNRSLGFDTECDVAIDAGDGKDGPVHREIRNIRNDLLAEHLGRTRADIEAAFERTGSLIETIQLCRDIGRTLRDYQYPDLNAAEKWLSEHDLMDPDSADDNFAASNLK